MFFLDTVNESYVGKQLSKEEKEEEGPNKVHQWDKVGRHAWAAAIVARKGEKAGKDMYIMDCDAAFPKDTKTVRKGELGVGMERRWVEAVGK